MRARIRASAAFSLVGGLAPGRPRRWSRWRPAGRSLGASPSISISRSIPIVYLFVMSRFGCLSVVGIEEFTDVPARLASVVDQLAKEFDGIYERSYIEAIVAESAKQLEGAAVASFVPILAHRFARERLRARAQAEGKLTKTAPEIVFVSVTGGGRARMAASLLEHLVAANANVHTAGSGAAAGIDDNVRVAMEELGIDLSEKFARPVTDEVLSSADLVITMGRSVGDVRIPAGARHLDWRVGDPDGASLEEVRQIRTDIERRVNALVIDLQEIAVVDAAAEP